MFFAGDINIIHATVPDLESTKVVQDEMDKPRKCYHRCHVPPNLMHPFCQTLEEIRINQFDNSDPYVIAFLLRHLPHLQQLETSDYEFKDYSASIRALWDLRHFTDRVVDSPMETDIPPVSSNPITLSAFTGNSVLFQFEIIKNMLTLNI